MLCPEPGFEMPTVGAWLVVGIVGGVVGGVVGGGVVVVPPLQLVAALDRLCA